MAINEKPHGFWTSLPGLLTAIAAIVTAATGAFVALKSTRPPMQEAAPAHLPETSSRPRPAPSDIPTFAGHWKRADGNDLLITQQGRRVQYDVKGTLVSLDIGSDGRIVDKKMLSYSKGEVNSESEADLISLSVWSVDGDRLRVTHYFDYRRPRGGQQPHTEQSQIAYTRVAGG